MISIVYLSLLHISFRLTFMYYNSYLTSHFHLGLIVSLLEASLWLFFLTTCSQKISLLLLTAVVMLSSFWYNSVVFDSVFTCLLPPLGFRFFSGSFGPSFLNSSFSTVLKHSEAIQIIQLVRCNIT